MYGSKSMSFFTVCRPIRKFSAGVGSVTSAPKSCRSKSASSKDCLKNIFFLVKSDATYTSQQITDMVGFFVCLFDSLRPLNNLSVMRDGSSWV